MWTVLFHVNPTTIALALGLCLAAALAFAWWRRPDPARFRGPMRKLLAAAAVVYLAVLVAPIGAAESYGNSERRVVWDPMLSFQDIPGVGEHADSYTEFGQRLDDGRAVRYAPAGVPLEERFPEDEDDLFVQDGPGDTLVVTDSEGGTPTPGDVALAERTVTENLAWIAEYDAQLEAEGPWGTTGGVALQERTLNTLLFVPIGVVAFFAFGSWPARVLFGPALSLAVEAAQWALPWGRLADTGDLMVNSVGAVVGTLLAAGAVGVVAVVRPGPSGAPDPEAGSPEEEPVRPARG
ncbi:VanZ family protein [Nocardiopsis ganjiahuensis]|uniref:VanZ family protein n=1 Tax=Nocardiopsis ganjiahuensis TaxID=239984 RepID=UPI00034C6A6F|nr:VanZ family protein [Nocardiopsis ganjiahuensis]